MNLIGVIVSMSIMSILTLSLMNINLNMMKTNNTASVNADILTYVTQFRSNLGLVSFTGNKLTASNLTFTGIEHIKPNASWKVKVSRFENVTLIGKGTYRATLVVVTESNREAVVGSVIQRKVIGDVFCTVKNDLVDVCANSYDGAPEPEDTGSGCNH